jgi:hypothetical protein
MLKGVKSCTGAAFSLVSTTFLVCSLPLLPLARFLNTELVISKAFSSLLEIPAVFSVFRPFIFSTYFSGNSLIGSARSSVSMCSPPTPMSGYVTSSSFTACLLAVSSSDGGLASLASVRDTGRAQRSIPPPTSLFQATTLLSCYLFSPCAGFCCCFSLQCLL